MELYIAACLTIIAVFMFAAVFILSEISVGISRARMEATMRGNGIADYLHDIYQQIDR